MNYQLLKKGGEGSWRPLSARQFQSKSFHSQTERLPPAARPAEDPVARAQLCTPAPASIAAPIWKSVCLAWGQTRARGALRGGAGAWCFRMTCCVVVIAGNAPSAQSRHQMSGTTVVQTSGMAVGPIVGISPKIPGNATIGPLPLDQPKPAIGSSGTRRGDGAIRCASRPCPSPASAALAPRPSQAKQTEFKMGARAQRA